MGATLGYPDESALATLRAGLAASRHYVATVARAGVPVADMTRGGVARATPSTVAVDVPCRILATPLRPAGSSAGAPETGDAERVAFDRDADVRAGDVLTITPNAAAVAGGNTEPARVLRVTAADPFHAGRAERHVLAAPLPPGQPAPPASGA